MSIQITIIGLGQVGASIGLALVNQKEKLLRVGHDADPLASKEAEKLGAVDKTHLNLFAAVENADIVVLAVPVDEVRKTLELIAKDLKEGCVVLDTATIQVAGIQWAAELLPEDRHYITLTPTINPAYLMDMNTGVQAAHADLFKDSMVIISAPSGADSDAIKLAADMTTLMGAKSYFCDPLEADGLLAASELLPKLTAAALLLCTQEQPGWREARKLTGAPYALGSAPVLRMDETKELGQSALLNKENSARMLGYLIENLQTLRQNILDEDEEALKKALDKAVNGRAEWWEQRRRMDWEINMTPATPTLGDVLGRLVGYRPRKNKPEEKK
jgi:prephenate dehydrogenase